VTTRALAIAVAAALAPSWLPAQTPLTPVEQRVRAAIAAEREDQVAYLRRVVEMPSATLNLAGVRRVGDVFRASFDSLGFTTHWVDLPAELNRAGHLIAEKRGRPGNVCMMLIGHLDTVVEPDSTGGWVRTDSMAAAIGGADMKGGDVVILYALRALHRAGALRDLCVTVIFTGDEEAPGRPLGVARAAMYELARTTDVALAFEGGNRSDATVARRGTSRWRVTATGRQAHSAGIFNRGTGYGAIYEISRILDGFRRELAGEEYLTFNVATILGGTEVAYDTARWRGTAESRDNIVPRAAVAAGDLRTLTIEQRDRARDRMRAIVAASLPGTSAEIVFEDGYPPMAPTPGNDRVLAIYAEASRALGHGAVTALDPGRRGAGDISFVAPMMDGLDGLGALGSGAHAPDECVNLNAMPMQTERAALLFLRLGSRPASEFPKRAFAPAP
jgi:glutamate carboxypeptidase